VTTLLFHKPYGVLSQFSPEAGSRFQPLANFVPVPNVYAAGRLDGDSEGLLILTDEGVVQQRLTDPRWGHWRRYWAQVEGKPSDAVLDPLRSGIPLQGRLSLPARARPLTDQEVDQAALGERTPPIRVRRLLPTSWIELELREGRNRQVRRMTAAVGLPTLRLLRVAIDLMDGDPPLDLAGLAPGQWRHVTPQERQRLDRLAGARNPQTLGWSCPGGVPIQPRASRSSRTVWS
jgi:23S rRNA pseudouridine2457 synthase